jgi:Heterokaryon incompatibility protein (HET)
MSRVPSLNPIPFDTLDGQQLSFCQRCKNFWASSEVQLDYTADQIIPYRNFCPLCALMAKFMHRDILLKSYGTKVRPSLYLSRSKNIDGSFRALQMFVNGIRFGTVFPLQFPGYRASPLKYNTMEMGSSLKNISLWLSKLLHTCIEGEESKEVEGSHHQQGFSLPQRYQAPIGLAFIDVLENRIVPGRSSARYLALSYVWGGVESLQLQSTNRTDLEQIGALLDRKYNIANVVRDAIQLTKEMGERLLWVDCLCIEQDNMAQKHTQIQQMDVVYNHALLTIAALSSPNANIGLPGIREDTLLTETFIVTIDGQNWKGDINHRWDRIGGFDANINYAYETRAWTYQERLLSRRCVFFTDTRPIYSCHGISIPYMGRTQPVQITESPSYMTNLLSRLKDSASHKSFQHWLLYADLVREYSKRKLSFPHDALNAFSGIIQFLERKFGSPFLYGLPENDLDRGLLFHVQDESRRRIGLPSWSWAGWDSPISYLGQVANPRGPDSMLNILGRMQPIISKMEIVRRARPREIKRSMSQFVSNNIIDPVETAKRDAHEELQALLCFKTEMVPFNMASTQFSRWPEQVLFLAVAKKLPGGQVTRIIPRKVRNASAYLLFSLVDYHHQETRDVSLQEIARLLDVNEQDLSLIAISISIVKEQKRVNVMLVKVVGDIFERVTIGQIDLDIWRTLQPLETEITLG